MTRSSRFRALLYVIAAQLLPISAPPTSAQAQSAIAEFYRGKQIKVIVGFGPGGSSGLYAEVVGRHMGRHLPGNPTFINQYMPGGGGLIAANQMSQRAAKDGSEIAITSRTAAFEPLFGNPQAQFDARKLNWIGSANIENSVCIADSATPVRSFDDVRKTELIVGGSGADAMEMIFPRIANRMLGANFKIVGGYSTSNDILLAMERGEVHGFCGVGWSLLKLRKSDLLAQKKINLLFQIAPARSPDIPDVPLIQEFARNADDRQVLEFLIAPQGMGRPFFAPAGVPVDRVKALRDAFAATMKDKLFLEDAEKTGLEIQLVTGEDVNALLDRAYATPPALVARAKAALKAN